MERTQFLMRFVYLDSGECITEANFLIKLPEPMEANRVKRKIARYHNLLREEADYVQSLEWVPEDQWSEKDRERAAEAEANNPYLFCQAQPDGLLNYICAHNKGWSYERPDGYFSLSDGDWF